MNRTATLECQSSGGGACPTRGQGPGLYLGGVQLLPFPYSPAPGHAWTRALLPQPCLRSRCCQSLLLLVGLLPPHLPPAANPSRKPLLGSAPEHYEENPTRGCPEAVHSLSRAVVPLLLLPMGARTQHPEVLCSGVGAAGNPAVLEHPQKGNGPLGVTCSSPSPSQGCRAGGLPPGPHGWVRSGRS